MFSKRARLRLVSSRCLQLSKRVISTNSTKKQTSRLFRKRNVAVVSALLVVGSYATVSLANHYRLDSVPSSLAGSNLQKLVGSASTSRTGSAASRAMSSLNSLDKQCFLSATSSVFHKDGAGSKLNKHEIEHLSDDKINSQLRQYEESYIVNRGKGVTRYDVSQLPSNSPIEDDRAEEIVQVPILQDNNIKTSTDWMFFGVYDGHGGWTTSTKLRDQLILYIIQEFGTIFKPAKEDNLRYVPNSATIDQAIKNGFLKLDHDIVTKNIKSLLKESNKAKAAELLMPALSGSCALLSFYDTNSKMLKVAVTGDSRAILGSYKDNRWTVRQLSIDQTGSNPSEVARIISEHPDEPNVIKNGRVLGSLEPSRAFGDCRYKLPGYIQKEIYQQFFGRRLPLDLKLPPYVTAEPVITTTKISPENNDFLVMASDGLYEMLSNEEIVGLVVKWMEKEKMVKPKTSFWSYFGSAEKELPQVADVTNDRSSKQPFRKTKQPGHGSFLLEDKNVSTHLIRNALSNGGSREQVLMLLSIPGPLSRRYRDDLTVTVVFFGADQQHDDSGKLEINAQATLGGSSSKPKL